MKLLLLFYMNDKLKLTITAIFFVATMQAQIFEPVPLDKKWHIGGGAFAGVWGTFAGNSLELSPEESALMGVATGLAAGIGKECFDLLDGAIMKQHHPFDPMDIAATTLGGVIGAGLSYAALKIFKKPPMIYSFTDANVPSSLIGFRLRYEEEPLT